MKLIDTDVIIDHFHGNALAREFLSSAIERGEMLCISVVTLAEVMAGVRPGEEEITEQLIGLFTIIGVDQRIARKAGAYLRQYAASHRIDLGDALIAATASILDAELATRNVKHYPMSDIHVTVPYQRGGRA